jgi:hypothetical protein
MNVQKHFHYTKPNFILADHSAVLHGLAWPRLRGPHLVVCQRLPRTRCHALRALRKSLPHTSVFFPSWSLLSNSMAIRCKECNVCPFICASIHECSVSILRRSITSCLLIVKCLNAQSVIRRPSSAILASIVSAESIHSSPSGLLSYTYSRPPPSTSSSDALMGRLGLSVGGDTSLQRAKTPPSLVPYKVP